MNYSDQRITNLIVGKTEKIPKTEIARICKNAKAILDTLPNHIEVERDSKTVIVGDIHGNLDDLLGIFRKTGMPEPGNNHINYIFLGDYVNRGLQSIEVMALLALLIVEYGKKNIHQFICLRGNHESKEISKVYGLLEECKKKYGEQEGLEVFDLFCDLFKYLPLAATINKDLFCVHAGISPSMKSVEDISKINRKVAFPNPNVEKELTKEEELFIDLVWSDPGTKKGFQPSPRGAGILYGEDELQKFLKINKLGRIIRSHQFCEGFKYEHGEKCLTIFSASNYCGKCGNKGSVAEFFKGKLNTLCYTYASIQEKLIDFDTKLLKATMAKEKNVSLLEIELATLENRAEREYKSQKGKIKSLKNQIKKLKQ